MSHVLGLLHGWLASVSTAQGRRLLCVVFCIDATFAFVFLVVLQTYFRPQHIAGASLPGLCLGLYGAGKLSLQYAAGRLSDRLGARRALQLGLATIGVCLALLLLAPRMPALVLVASAAYGAAGAICWPAIYGNANAFEPRQRSQITAAMTVTTGLSLAAALGLGFLLPETFSYSAAMAGTALVLALGLLQTREDDVVLPYRPKQSKPATLLALLSDASYLQVGLAFFLQSLALGVLVSIFRAIGRDLLHASLRGELVMLTPAASAFAVGVVLAGLLGRADNRSSLLAVALFVSAAGFVVLTQADGRPLQLIAVSLACLGLGTAVPMTTAASLDLAGSSSGALFGALLTLEGLGNAIGPAFGAVLSDTGSSLALVSGALAVAGIVMVLRPDGEASLEPQELASDG